MKNVVLTIIMLLLFSACKKEKAAPADIRDRIVHENYEGYMTLYDDSFPVNVAIFTFLRKNSEHSDRIDVIDKNTNTVIFYLEQIEQSDTLISFTVPKQIQGNYIMEGTRILYVGQKTCDGFYYPSNRLMAMLDMSEKNGLFIGHMKVDLERVN
jgi:hypothetical protein